MGLNNLEILVCVWILFVSVVADKQGEPELMGAEDKRQQGDEQDCVKMSDTSWPEYRRQAEDHQVQFLLLTRSNIDCVKLFNQESLSETKKSYFDVSRPTKVIVHGYSAMGNRPSWVKKLAKTLLRVQDVNVLVVDWLHIASRAYNRVVENYKDVSLQISVLINRLQDHGCELESFHFICLSLGSHVAGFVGTLFEGQIGKITALDPAGPMFKGADVYDRLDPSDARFVEAIHSDADYFGISIPVGHVDFFLNGGKDQTGCTRKSLSSLSGYVFCDHMRALYVYMSSLESSCPLHGIPCSSYEDFLKGLCVDCEDFNGKCPTIGPSENAGIVVSPIPKEQKLYLLTTSQPPYCAHHILLKLEVSALIKSAEVEVSLRTDDQESKQRIRMKKDTTEYRMVLSHPVPLCQIHFIEMKNTGSRFYRQAEVHFQSVCVSEFPSLSQDLPICVNNFNVRRGAPWSHDFVQVC